MHELGKGNKKINYKETEAGYTGERGGDRDTGKGELIEVSDHHHGNNLYEILQNSDRNHRCRHVAHHL